MSEVHNFVFEGHPVRIHLSHADADRILAQAGWLIPSIPEGCNTSVFYFTTKEGFEAVAINQRGHAPIASDDEHEVNGCGVTILLDKTLDLIDARALLKRFQKVIEES